jgi:hypothetical protein
MLQGSTDAYLGCPPGRPEPRTSAEWKPYLSKVERWLSEHAANKHVYETYQVESAKWRSYVKSGWLLNLSGTRSAPNPGGDSVTRAVERLEALERRYENAIIRYRLVQGALDALGRFEPEHKRILELFYVENRSIAWIAAEVYRSESWTNQHKRHALEQIARYLGAAVVNNDL